MIAINIIQYKFRNDLLDDLECSSSNINNNNNNNSNQISNEKNCSNQSLTNTTNSNNDQNNEHKNTNLVSNCDELEEDCHGKLLKKTIDHQSRKNIASKPVDNQSVYSQGYVEHDLGEDEQYEQEDEEESDEHYYQRYCKQDEEDDDDDQDIEYRFHSKRAEQFKSSKNKSFKAELNEDNDDDSYDGCAKISKEKVTSDSGNSSTYSDEPVQTHELKSAEKPKRLNKMINKKSLII
jgi:hypothetical protein